MHAARLRSRWHGPREPRRDRSRASLCTWPVGDSCLQSGQPAVWIEQDAETVSHYLSSAGVERLGCGPAQGRDPKLDLKARRELHAALDDDTPLLVSNDGWSAEACQPLVARHERLRFSYQQDDVHVGVQRPGSASPRADDASSTHSTVSASPCGQMIRDVFDVAFALLKEPRSRSAPVHIRIVRESAGGYDYESSERSLPRFTQVIVRYLDRDLTPQSDEAKAQTCADRRHVVGAGGKLTRLGR